MLGKNRKLNSEYNHVLMGWRAVVARMCVFKYVWNKRNLTIGEETSYIEGQWDEY